MTDIKSLWWEDQPVGPWALGAACAGDPDPEQWFASDGPDQASAKATCRTCPVRAECLDYALSCGSMLVGVWGGTGETERAQIRHKRAKADAT